MTTPRILGQNSPPQNPNSRVLGWHFDYQLSIGALANGATTPERELRIEPGAPFCLRAIGGYNVTPAGAGPASAATLRDAFIQFTDSSDNWLQTTLVGTSGDWSQGGLNALYEPVYNQIVYAPNSVIAVRITNSSGADWADARIVFRGTKLYYKDRVYNACYPACYNAIPYSVPMDFTFQATGSPPTLRAPAGQLIAKGADFVIRGVVIQADSSVVDGSIGDLECLLQDQYEKPYANEYIHYNWLFSQNFASRPGIFYPEWYLPKDRLMLINLKQGSGAPCTVQLNFMGERIFPK